MSITNRFNKILSTSLDKQILGNIDRQIGRYTDRQSQKEKRPQLDKQTD